MARLRNQKRIMVCVAGQLSRQGCDCAGICFAHGRSLVTLRCVMTSMMFILAVTMWAMFIPSMAIAQGWSTPGVRFGGEVYDLKVSASGEVFVANGRFGLFRSGPDLGGWEQIFVDDSVSIELVEDTVYVGGDDGLYVSRDRGLKWRRLIPAKVASFSVNHDQIAVGGYGGQLYFSADSGVSWNTINGTVMPLGFDREVTSVAVSANGLAYIHSWSSLFVLGDSNAFVRLAPPSEGAEAAGFRIAPDGAFFLGGGSRFFESRDGGRSFHFIASAPVSGLGIRAFDIQYPLLVAEDFNGKVVVSPDGGVSFDDWTGGSQFGYNPILAIGPTGRLYRASNGYVQVSGVPIGVGLTGEQPTMEDYTERELQIDVYPDPFVTGSRIVISVPRSENLNVELFDLLGRRVATLMVDQPAYGETAVTLPIGLSAARYLLRARTSTSTATKMLAISR